MSYALTAEQRYGPILYLQFFLNPNQSPRRSFALALQQSGRSSLKIAQLGNLSYDKVNESKVSKLSEVSGIS